MADYYFIVLGFFAVILGFFAFAPVIQGLSGLSNSTVEGFFMINIVSIVGVGFILYGAVKD